MSCDQTLSLFKSCILIILKSTIMKTINPTGIVPVGCKVNFNAAHDRDRLGWYGFEMCQGQNFEGQNPEKYEEIILKFFYVIALILGLMISPVIASPPNVICAGGKAGEAVRFIFPLITENGSVNENLIVPFYTRNIVLMYGPTNSQQKIRFERDDIIGLWLDDDRIDIRFYREEKDDNDKISAFDLKVRTVLTKERSEESGPFIYKGNFVFRALEGPLRAGFGTILHESEGEVICD